MYKEEIIFEKKKKKPGIFLSRVALKPRYKFKIPPFCWTILFAQLNADSVGFEEAVVLLV